MQLWCMFLGIYNMIKDFRDCNYKKKKTPQIIVGGKTTLIDGSAILKWNYGVSI